MAADRANRDKEEVEDGDLREHIMWLASGTLLAALGLLFWAVASSPTSSLLAMCGARPSGAAPAEVEAKRLLENLSIGAGLPTPKLYVIDTAAPNAFAAGVDPRRSVVAVTSGLLGLLDTRELEGVLAHELSHIGNRDTRLNTIVASIALFMRLPHLLRQQKRNARLRPGSTPLITRPNIQIYRWALSPVYLYIYVVAPVLATAIRAAISRSREFLADADAALLTRYPEGLIRALSKIRGAGSVVEGANPAVSHLYFADPSAVASGFGVLAGNLMATHPPIDRRIERLLEFNGGTPASVIESAVRAGQDFTKDHPIIAGHNPLDNVTRDELSVITMGNPMGRVCQVLGGIEPFPLYDHARPGAPVITRVAPGDLLIVFDDPGPMRQVITHNDTYGFLPMSVKLKRVDMMPAEIHDATARNALKEAYVNSVAPRAGSPQPVGASGLTRQQMIITVAVMVVVCAAGLVILALFAGK
jgi:heat shock protein HtpX